MLTRHRYGTARTAAHIPAAGIVLLAGALLVVGAKVRAQDTSYLAEMPSASRVVDDLRTQTSHETAARAGSAVSQLRSILRQLAEGRALLPAEAAKDAEYARIEKSLQQAELAKRDPNCRGFDCDGFGICLMAYLNAPAWKRELLDTYFSAEWQTRYAPRLQRDTEWRTAWNLPVGTKAADSFPPTIKGICAGESVGKRGSQTTRQSSTPGAAFGATVGSLQTNPLGLYAGGLILFLGASALMLFVVYRLVTSQSRRTAREHAAALGPTLEAWTRLGPTAEEREANIKKLFDTKSATLPFGIRYDIQNGQVVSELQSGTSSIATGHVGFRISRNIGAMEQREREFLRSTYLLYNSGLISRQQWLLCSFAFISGDGKAQINSWESSGCNVNDGPAAIRFFRDQTNGSVDSAINVLMSVVERAGTRADQPPVAKEIRSRLRGGGAWLTAEDVPGSIFADGGPYALKLGVLDDDGKPQVLTYAGEGSLMTIAPPGSGKTQCFVLPTLLSWPGAAVVLDIKGEIYAGTSKWRSQNVGPVFRFSPLDAAHSHSYNPLTFIRQHPDFLWEDARFLADMMIVPSGAADPFWENTSRDVLTAAIAYVCYTNEADQRALTKVMDLIYGIGWDDMVLSLKTNLAMTAMRQMGHSLAEMEKKTRDSVLKTAQSSLSAWQGERLGRVTRTSDWSPLDLRTTKATIYICINPNEIDSYLSVLRVFIAQHIRMLTSELPSRGAAPILFVLDELPRLKKMPPVDEGLSIGRQYGIRLWMFAQSYGQLKDVYTNAEGMLGSCAVRTFMNVPLNDDIAQKLSDQLGFRDGPLDVTRTKLVEPLELAGPNYRDIVLVLATNTKPARVRKAFAYLDPELVAKMG